MNILLINAHTREQSFCTALAESYEQGACNAGHKVQTLNIRDLNLEKYLNHGHESRYTPEGDIVKAQELIDWCDHLVFVYPIWWAGLPALLHLFFEMVFSPGFAFKYQDTTGNIVKWDKLLKGKSARLIVTMDSPPWYYRWIIGDPGGKMMKRGILGFSGVAPITSTYIGSIKMSTDKRRTQWLEKAYSIGNSEPKC